MQQIPFIMPQLGEAIAEATIISFLAQPGDIVEADQDVVEVETNKATMNVSSPARGKVVKWTAKKDESYAVGEVLGYLEVKKEDAERLGLDEPASSDSDTAETKPATPAVSEQRRGVEPTVRGLPVPAHAAGASYMSPRMKARMNELGLHAADLSAIAGSGAAGRVTIEDLEKYLTSLDKLRLSEASTMRVAVADAMRRSWTRAARDRRPARATRRRARASQERKSETRARALCLARPRAGAGREQRARRPPCWQQDRPPARHRHRRGRGS